ncbi:hypothetical protein OEIGOIKO_04997 [Streptomyces chrestomyceticus JCM 4735]|uniref:Lipoprotein n=1 Tax=Streptomyces chrestomyceticus JCM 4735 TaxID=1306181 RepID=A0A7U9KXH8_9ACTN|nr:hypothetical protein [Streptomyces chrestomyceticus]GCD37212.1 hypothetical protein OEIGOIKO_04997 [Streptomyces chrestomyceticus JCM 4735]
MFTKGISGRQYARRGACALAAAAAALALQTGTAAASGAGGVPAPAAHSAPASAPAPAPASAVRITEGQVGEAAPGGALLYPSVTSCLTVTVHLADGRLVGAHASLFQVPGEYRSDRILGALRDRVGGRDVTAVEVRGAVGAWLPGYFTKAIESYGDGESVPFPSEPDPDGLAAAVADGLGQPHAKVTVTDVPDGDQTVR